ncbi:hypothetical protein [Kibdelosporangium aridum]|uniref:hypothetical protein n=1 Tax=Kibdelosporangium aridum TaxID=2030 RepID=UPI000B0870C3|nr:hypothetical protein [Kibdelosporangium aridum]
MAKHAAGPGAPAFKITAADRDHPPKHSKEDRKPELMRVVIDVKNGLKRAS